MAIHRYNETFAIGAGAARRLAFGSKSVGEADVRWGDAYSVYNPALGRNFILKHGFASVYESTELPESKGRPLCELLGLPLGNEANDGHGLWFQHFENGYLTWREGAAVQVVEDFPIGAGRGRKIPSEWDAIPQHPGWGEVYWVQHPNGQRNTIVRGFAQVYDKDRLGLPLEDEHSDGKDGAIQRFQRGVMRWSPAGGITITDVAPAALDLAKSDRVALKPLSLKDIAAKGGQPAAARPVRLRIAPSPTGYLHIGNAWVATMNYLMAKKLGGEFLLRIEDTDPLRSKPEYTEVIKQSLSWLGLAWDGEVVFQSQRTALYTAKVEQLLAAGHAYRDPKSGAVFFKMPDRATQVVQDRVKGRVEIPLADENGQKDFMLLRPDGSPMFLLANTVDDGEQGITHVVRGEGHLLNAARQISLFEALGYQVPELYHLPHIVGEGGAKLSKREGASSVLDFKAQGLDPEVLLHHLAGLGTKTELGDEALGKDALVERFDRLAFAKTGSRIGFGRLAELSRRHLAGLDVGELKRRLNDRDPELLRSLGPVGAHALADAAKKRASTYEEALQIGRFLLEAPRYGEKAVSAIEGPIRAILLELLGRLEGADWKLGPLRVALDGVNRDRGIKDRDYVEAAMWALTGDTSGLPIEHTLAILGKARSIERLKAVLEGRVELSAERRRVSGPAPKAEARPVERPKVYELGGEKLKAWIRYAKLLGAPTGEARQDPPFSNRWMQDFEHGEIGEAGAIRLREAPFWMVGGKLDAYLANRAALGLPIGEAYRNREGVWVQDFEHGQTDDNRAVRLGERGGAGADRALVVDGQMVQETGHAPVYLIAGGAKLWVHHPDVIGALGYTGAQILQLAPGTLDTVAPVPVDGTLVRERQAHEVYLIRAGQKLHVPDVAAFEAAGFKMEEVKVVPDHSLEGVPTGGWSPP